MTERFGSSNKDDPTAQMEADAEWAAGQVVEFIRDAAEHVLNRGPGTKVVSRADQHTEWELAMLDPQALAASFEAYANLVGPENAAATFLKWDAKHKAMGPAPEPVSLASSMPLPGMTLPPMDMNGANYGST